jgi:hypothetical protein
MSHVEKYVYRNILAHSGISSIKLVASRPRQQNSAHVCAVGHTAGFFSIKTQIGLLVKCPSFLHDFNQEVKERSLKTSYLIHVNCQEKPFVTRVVQEVTLQTCLREMHGSNLDRDTGPHNWGFPWDCTVTLGKCPLSTSHPNAFHIHHRSLDIELAVK